MCQYAFVVMYVANGVTSQGSLPLSFSQKKSSDQVDFLERSWSRNKIKNQESIDLRTLLARSWPQGLDQCLNLLLSKYKFFLY